MSTETRIAYLTEENMDLVMTACWPTQDDCVLDADGNRVSRPGSDDELLYIKDGIGYVDLVIHGIVWATVITERLDPFKENVLDMLRQLPEAFWTMEGQVEYKAIHDRQGRIWTRNSEEVHALFATGIYFGYVEEMDLDENKPGEHWFRMTAAARELAEA